MQIATRAHVYQNTCTQLNCQCVLLARTHRWNKNDRTSAHFCICHNQQKKRKEKKPTTIYMNSKSWSGSRTKHYKNKENCSSNPNFFEPFSCTFLIFLEKKLKNSCFFCLFNDILRHFGHFLNIANDSQNLYFTFTPGARKSNNKVACHCAYTPNNNHDFSMFGGVILYIFFVFFLFDFEFVTKIINTLNYSSNFHFYVVVIFFCCCFQIVCNYHREIFSSSFHLFHLVI